MLRFIDLRNQGTYYRFAWFNTSDAKFLRFDGEMCWDTFAEFEQALVSDETNYEVDRFRSLTPAWAFENPTGYEEKGFENGKTEV